MKVIHLMDFGARPNSGEDTVLPMRRALEAAAAQDMPVVLACSEGCYDFYPEHAAKVPFYITNSASEQETPDVTKTIGVLLQGLRNIVLEGNGALFRFHGKFTMFVFDQCKNIEVRNLSTDFSRPTMSEMTVAAIAPGYIEVSVHPDSWYELHDGKLHWKGEGWTYQDGPAQLFDPAMNTTWRVPSPISSAIHIEEIEHGRLRLHYEKGDVPDTAVGLTYQMRDGIRDQAGVFIHRSSSITWKNVNLHYTHGLGVVGQYSENLTFDGLAIVPRKESGRTAAAFADGIHLSGCRGLVQIVNCQFEGTHDDPINIHGTHLRVIDKPSANQILVRFMHGQSYGFDAFFPGDHIEFVRAHSLAVFDSNIVTDAQRINARDILLTLDKPPSDSIAPHDVIENVTWTPQVEIRNNRFARIPTRGILVTTRRKVVIEQNHFDRLMMSGILIADDAESWFESGRVEDVTIRQNTFNHCGGREHPVIYIAPENRHVDLDIPVHRNIRIEENCIHTADALLLDAKSTRGLTFRENDITFTGTDRKPNDLTGAFRLTACSGVQLQDNKII
ncbi:right-handed parallel beta-helix repeat-containing protein [Paenibacillus sp. OV219]|uniref:right-handed parallel beta-helix repeat-containing protein n=1 Tax=Paenibacillus sp. OV219 TaxID=1884377 RepID=UPI0008C81C2B|nr:right-handed parallel beta-helix repeat-containing protein [Paenibacillus sp. OV219]SEO89799.1 Right handed beta helix region [Paenibacillus sp. OV219]